VRCACAGCKKRAGSLVGLTEVREPSRSAPGQRHRCLLGQAREDPGTRPIVLLEARLLCSRRESVHVGDRTGHSLREGFETGAAAKLAPDAADQRVQPPEATTPPRNALLCRTPPADAFGILRHAAQQQRQQQHRTLAADAPESSAILLRPACDRPRLAVCWAALCQPALGVMRTALWDRIQFLWATLVAASCQISSGGLARSQGQCVAGARPDEL